MTERETLTAERALQLLREVVAERPGYVYASPDKNGCVYIDKVSGEPSCLIGHVLIRAGWSPVELEPVNTRSVYRLPWEFHQHINEDAAVLLQKAQKAQDVGRTWDQALHAAEEFARAEVTG